MAGAHVRVAGGRGTGGRPVAGHARRDGRRSHRATPGAAAAQWGMVRRSPALLPVRPRARRARRAGPFAGAPPARCAAVVCVPAKDEERGVGDLFAALARQTRRDFEVLLLANNCRDDTAAAARFHARRLGLRAAVAEARLPRRAAHVGTARRLLGRAAVGRFAAAGVAGGVVLTTDADTRPEPGWLAANLAAIAAGADCVCGRVKTDPPDLGDAAGRRAGAAHALRQRHRRLADRLACLLAPDPADPWPRHHDEAGASLCVTADVLDRCGGVPAVGCSEDVALVAAVRRAGGTVRHDPRVAVRTSRRRDGRCPGGLADLLNRLADGRAPADLLVEDPRCLDRRLRAGGPAADDGTTPRVPLDRAVEWLCEAVRGRYRRSNTSSR